MGDTENKVPAPDTIVQDPSKRDFIKHTAGSVLGRCGNIDSVAGHISKRRGR